MLNKVALIGRLTRDPDVRYTQGDSSMCVARYTLAVDRRGKKQDGQPNADFISCVAFGKSGEFADKYLHKGMKICVAGHIQTGSYTNKEGNKIYTTDVVVEEYEFCESKGESDTLPSDTPKENVKKPESTKSSFSHQEDLSGFMDIPDSFENNLPFV